MPSILNATTSSGLVTSADNSGSLQLATNNGTTAVTIDTSQNVGIGTASPNNVITSYRGAGVSNYIQFTNATTGTASTDGCLIGVAADDTALRLRVLEAAPIIFTTSDTERMRIASNGDLFINRTSTFSYANGKVCIDADGSGNPGLVVGVSSTSAAYNNIVLGNSTGGVGRIQTNGSATSYLTSSDYRLKNNVSPIQNAVATIESLNPVAFTWNVDNRQDTGFLAHEFQEILPNYADGTKDGVDAEGNPAYQAVDKSGVIPFLVKAIQEQQAIITDLKSRIEALEVK